MHNVILTTEQAQLIEDALENWFAQTPDTSHLDIKLFVLDTKQALSIIRAARAQEPVAVVDFDTQSWRNLVDALTKLPDGTKLYAEHDNKTEEKPLLVQAWEKRFAEQAEQEPVAKVIRNEAGQITMQKPDGNYFDISKHVGEYFYAAPVRTKDLTDDEIWDATNKCSNRLDFARAVIAKFKEKNK